MLGHNSAAFNQTLVPVKPRAVASAPRPPKPPKGRFPYFKFYPRDWIEATRSMSLEARGAYIDLICLIMEMEGHLADNDAWISHQMHVSTRKWKAVKKQLVEHEKIRVDDGKIVNERCLKELDSLLTQRRNLADSAVSRERTKREKSEKANKNNEPDTTTVPLRARVTTDSDTDLREERKKDNTPPPSEHEAARASGGGQEISGLNGATHALIEKLAGWINPMMPDRMTARASLENLVRTYPPDIIRDGFAHVEGKVLSGEFVPTPIKYLVATCRGMHAESIRPQNNVVQKSAKPETWGQEQDRLRAQLRAVMENTNG